MNETDGYHPHNVGIAHTVVFCLLWATALLLNVTSFGLLCQAIKARCSWGNILVISISLSDTLVLILGLIPSLISLFINDLLHDAKGLCYFQYIVLNTFIVTNFFLVAFVSIDQYVATSYPFVYSVKILRNAKRSLKIIGAILLLIVAGSIGLSVVTVASQADIEPVIPSIFCYYDFDSRKYQNIVFSLINIVLMGLISIAVIVCTILIGIKLYSSSKSTKQQHQQQTNLAKLAAVIAIVYLSCTLPFMVCIYG